MTCSLAVESLPAGPSTRRRVRLDSGEELIGEATRQYGLVVLDAPPLHHYCGGYGNITVGLGSKGR
jgi:hypothetical protein